MAEVRIDERARTLSALLAATDWPEREQQAGPFGIHAQAVALRRHAESFRDHPGAAFLQQALDTISDDSALYFEVVLNMSWPDFDPGSVGTRVATREITRKSGIRRRFSKNNCFKKHQKEVFFGPCQRLFPPELNQVAGEN